MMRWWIKIEKHSYIHIIFTFLILLLIYLSVLPGSTALSIEEKVLFIVIHDSDTNLPIEEDIFFEGKKYDIAIGCEGSYGYEYNVTVDIPWEGAYITSQALPWITVEAPSFEEYPEFVLTAFKNGYTSLEQEIGVLKGELYLTTDRGTVKEKESFSVTIRDQNNNMVEGCIVYLEGFESESDTTSSNGIAYISAPEVDENTELNICAFKGGYLTAATSIRVESESVGLIDDGFYPIIASLLVLVFAMLFVRVRKDFTRKKNKSKLKPLKTNDNTKINKNNLVSDFKSRQVNSTKKIDEVLPSIKKGPWVEEIRIHQPHIKKETKLVQEKKEVSQSHKKKECDWFKGKEYMKYKIDELTGEIDDQKDGKWFEGIDDIKSKVDKKLRDSCKK